VLLGFVAVSLVVIVVPGPDTALTVRNALVRGRSAGVLTAIGVAGGQAVWATLTALGVASVLQASEPAILTLRVCGAAYLCYLGAHALLIARRGRYPHGVAPAKRAPRTRTISLWQGLVSNLANPKMAVFFLSLLPQFVGTDASSWSIVGLGIVFSAMTLLWLSACAIAVARAGSLLRRTGIRRAVDAVAGTILVALGIRLAAEPL
jgi:threonine/homoserine/homoserine lactone efflux protein